MDASSNLLRSLLASFLGLPRFGIRLPSMAVRNLPQVENSSARYRLEKQSSETVFFLHESLYRPVFRPVRVLNFPTN